MSIAQRSPDQDRLSYNVFLDMKTTFLEAQLNTKVVDLFECCEIESKFASLAPTWIT